MLYSTQSWNTKYSGVVGALAAREIGFKSIRRDLYDPLCYISKLQLRAKLVKHGGCVNTIEWNDAGSLLISGSDDCALGVWDAATWELRGLVHTGHSHNIFCAKFVPETADTQAVSCGLDGEVRLVHLGGQSSPRLMAENDEMLLSVNFVPGCPSTFLTTQKDGTVRVFDLRQAAPHSEGSSGPVLVDLSSVWGGLSALCFHPARPSIFAVGAGDPIVRLYDMRYLLAAEEASAARSSPTPTVPWGQFAPVKPPAREEGRESWSWSRQIERALLGSDDVMDVTGLDLTARGELLANYRGADVFLFDTTDAPEPGATSFKVVQSYKGRANSDTFLKQAKFLYHGAEEFVATGGDCGCLYIWHKRTAHLVRRIQADSTTVNSVAPHPQLPHVATSGIDSDVKVWECSAGEDTVCRPGSRGESSAPEDYAAVIRLCFASASASASEGQGASGSDRSHSVDSDDMETDDDDDDDDSDDGLSGSSDSSADSDDDMISPMLFRAGRRRGWLGQSGMPAEVVTPAEACERLESARRRHDQGDAKLAAAQDRQAVELYLQATGLLHFHPPSPQLKERQQGLMSACLVARAGAEVRLGRYAAAAQHCRAVLAVEPRNGRAHRLRTAALLGLGALVELDDLAASLQAAIAHTPPEDEEGQRELQQLQDQKQREEGQRRRECFSVSGGSSPSSASPPSE